MNTGGSILIVTMGVIWKVLILNHYKSQKDYHYYCFHNLF